MNESKGDSTHLKRNISLQKDGKSLSSFTINLLAGGGSGCLETVITYPLDLVKTRLQLESTLKYIEKSPSRKRYCLDIIGMEEYLV